MAVLCSVGMNDVQVWKTCNFVRPFSTFTSQEMLLNVGVLHLCLEMKRVRQVSDGHALTLILSLNGCFTKNL
jgi:hypothetical protein